MMSHGEKLALSGRVRGWLKANRWSIEQMGRALSECTHGAHKVGREGVTALVKDRRISDGQARIIRQFLDANPAPGSYADYACALALRVQQRIDAERAALLARKDEVAQARERRNAALLAAERAPRPRTGIFPSARWLHQPVLSAVLDGEIAA